MRSCLCVGVLLAHTCLAPAQDRTPDDAPPAGDQVAADKALLKQKLEELRTLRAEVDRLREATGTAAELVLVHIRSLSTSAASFRFWFRRVKEPYRFSTANSAHSSTWCTACSTTAEFGLSFGHACRESTRNGRSRFMASRFPRYTFVSSMPRPSWRPAKRCLRAG